MREKENGNTKADLIDPARAAYMIAWRDRHIKKQEQLLHGYEEQTSLLEGLLAFVLCKKAQEHGMLFRIPKAELRAMLNSYVCEVENGEEEFLIRFCEKQESDNGKEQEEK